MKKRIAVTTFGFAFLIIGALAAAFINSGLIIFLVAILLGCIGMLMIAWGVMYFERKFPQLKTETHSDMKESKTTSSELFREAEKSIRILTGNLNHNFYNDDEIINHFDEALQRGVNIEVLAGPEIDKNSERLVKLAQSNSNFTITCLPYYPKRHFMIIDGRHVRAEEKHSLGLARHSKITATILYDRSFLTSQLNHFFNTLKAQIHSAPSKN